MSIGQRLREARKKRGISQSDLAEKIGASRGVITNIELDKVREPQTIVIKALCDALEIDADWLTTGNGSMDGRGGETATKGDEGSNTVSQIINYVEDLSENEQLYILDTIRTYITHLKD